VAVYDACVPLANRYVRAVLNRYDAELAETTGALTVEGALAHYAAREDVRGATDIAPLATG
jgi:hypothetical protein